MAKKTEVKKKKGQLRVIENKLPAKHAGGAPRIVFNLEAVEVLGREFCSKEACAFLLGVSSSVLYDHPEFLEAYKKGETSGQETLRKQLLKMAADGNTTAAIWLSKQHLGYRDKQPEEIAQTVFNIQINQVPK